MFTKPEVPQKGKRVSKTTTNEGLEMINNEEIKRIMLQRNLTWTSLVYREVEDNDARIISGEQKSYMVQIMTNLESLGYTLSEKFFNFLSTTSVSHIKGTYNAMLPILKEIKGDHVVHEPFYPGFPEQVEDMEEIELYFNAIIHYLTLARPVQTPIYRKPLEQRPLETIDVMSLDDALDVAKTVMKSSSSPSPQDLELLEYTTTPKLVEGVTEIPNRETKAAVVGNLLISPLYNLYKDQKSVQHAVSLLDTPTDALRVATYISQGDVSLAANTKFVSLPRATRRVIMETVERNPDEESIKRHANKWKRLAEILHTGTYRTKYPKAYALIQKVREGDHLESFNGKVEKAILDEDPEAVIKLLRTRPTDFARRLDHVLRTFPGETDPVLNEFSKVGTDVSLPNLITLFEYFSQRDKKMYRAFNPKGLEHRLFLRRNELESFGLLLKDRIIDTLSTCIQSKLHDLPDIGKVYLAGEMEQYTLPKANRSYSKKVKSVPRGSYRFIENDDNLRFFIHWKNVKGDKEYHEGRVDLDLSILFLDENYERLDHVSYTHLRNGYAVHSGDITDAPAGASEFVDINMDKAVSAGVKYIVPGIYAFTSHSFEDIPECFAGVMERQDMKKGQTFDPRSVTNKFDLTNGATTNTPMYYDVSGQKMVWIDMSISNEQSVPLKKHNTVEQHVSHIASVIEDYQTKESIRLHDLIMIHVNCRRGELVETKEEADLVVDVDGDLKPTDLERITYEFMDLNIEEPDLPEEEVVEEEPDESVGKKLVGTTARLTIKGKLPVGPERDY